jgi:hypothetical protein
MFRLYSIKKQLIMYTVYYNHKTNAHSIINNELDLLADVNDVSVHEGSLEECRAYLAPLNTIFLTIP